MKLLNSLKRAAPPESAAIAELRECIAARPTAVLAVEAERAKVKRLEDEADAPREAQRKLTTRKQEEAAAQKRWIDSGCDHITALAHHQATQATAEAARAAELATANVAAISRALALARSELASKESQIGQIDVRIDGAAKLCVVEENAELLERGARLADDFRAWRVEVKALEAVVEFEPRLYENVSPARRKAAAIVEEALDRATIKTWYQERDSARGWQYVNDEPEPVAARLKERSEHFRTRAAALLREALNAK